MKLFDKTLPCILCKNQFTWTAADQEFYRERGLKQPKRCKACREARKALFEGNQIKPGVAISVHVNCSECEKSTSVPFVPADGRPVLCRDCFQKARLTA
jgi:CxxC-x17-CxxC domain-containing protein